MLRDYQDALAHRLVDAQLRARLSATRIHAGEQAALWRTLGLELSDAEQASLAGIDAQELERAAQALADKRAAAVGATVPHTRKSWPELLPRYRELLAQRPPRLCTSGEQLGPGAAELTRLRGELLTLARRDPLAPPWLPDLFALELARACVRDDRSRRVLDCDYPVHRALAALDAGWLSMALEPEAGRYLVGPAGIHWTAQASP